MCCVQRKFIILLFCCTVVAKLKLDLLVKSLKSGAMLADELGDEDQSVSGDSMSEWRSCDQVDNGSPSTSPPFWDTDGEDDDPGEQ